MKHILGLTFLIMLFSCDDDGKEQRKAMYEMSLKLPDHAFENVLSEAQKDSLLRLGSCPHHSR